MKEEFLLLLQSVQREGMDKLLAYIEKTDFFKAPASTRFHGNHEGGLLEHSLNVYHLLKEKLLHKPYSDIVKASDETIILITLLHDFCKANYYTVDYRNKKMKMVFGLKNHIIQLMILFLMVMAKNL